MRGIIVRVNIVCGLFDGNISASGIIVRSNIVWGLSDGNVALYKFAAPLTMFG